MSIEWPQIIREIQRIHRCGEPLNISAVKRNHPELIRAVYAVKPFRGWKMALEDAGINYAKIKVELQDTVKCEACGKFYRNLGNHLLLKHHIPADEYLMDYPDADLQSETLRADKTTRGPVSLRHWEPIWTREYALDRLAEYRRRGFPVHQAKVEKYDTSLYLFINRHCNGWKSALASIGLDPRAITMEGYCLLRRYRDKESVIAAIQTGQKKGLHLSRRGLLGMGPGQKSDCALYSTGVDLFGSWREALRAAGIEPEIAQMAGAKREKYPSPESVIKEIRGRIARKWPVNHAALYRGPHIDVTLVVSGKYYFGSWKNTLQAVGIDAIALTAGFRQQTRKYPDRQSVMKAIRRRIKRGWSLSSTDLMHGKNRDSALVERGREYFGSWRQALSAAGFDAQAFYAEFYRKKLRYPDRQSIMKAIRLRIRRHWPINASTLLMGEHRDPTLTIRGREYFGSWAQALKAAGVKLKGSLLRTGVRKYRTREDIIEAICARHKRKLPLTATGIVTGKNRDYMLCFYAKEYFGSWLQTLKAAGINPAEVYDPIRLRRTKYPDAMSLLKVIEQRAKAGRPLNFTGIACGRERDLALISGANRFFGSWNNALKKAGFDPKQIKHDSYSRAVRERLRQRKLRH